MSDDFTRFKRDISAFKVRYRRLTRRWAHITLDVAKLVSDLQQWGVIDDSTYHAALISLELAGAEFRNQWLSLGRAIGRTMRALRERTAPAGLAPSKSGVRINPHEYTKMEAEVASIVEEIAGGTMFHESTLGELQSLLEFSDVISVRPVIMDDDDEPDAPASKSGEVWFTGPAIDPRTGKAKPRGRYRLNRKPTKPRSGLGRTEEGIRFRGRAKTLVRSLARRVAQLQIELEKLRKVGSIIEHDLVNVIEVLEDYGIVAPHAWVSKRLVRTIESNVKLVQESGATQFAAEVDDILLNVLRGIESVPVYVPKTSSGLRPKAKPRTAKPRTTPR